MTWTTGLRRWPLKSLERFLEGHYLLTFLLAGAFIWSLTSVDWSGPLVHTGGASTALKFFLALFPPDLSPGFLAIALQASWQTLVYAVAGITLAVIIGLPLGVIASGTVVTPGSRLKTPLIASTRLFLGGMRAIHELVWAVLFVAAIGLSPMAGIIALGIPYAGILGRIYSELLQDVPPEPVRALRSSGASPLRVLWYGYIPMALPDMLSYTFYRFECAIRAAAILSFVGIQGLGYQIQLSLHDLLFNQVWTLLLFMMALIVAVDWWSMRVRRSLVT
jgi:phosphonate ABC transporter permease subunit PhnE